MLLVGLNSTVLNQATNVTNQISRIDRDITVIKDGIIGMKTSHCLKHLLDSILFVLRQF